jgi:hypothetical protein
VTGADAGRQDGRSELEKSFGVHEWVSWKMLIRGRTRAALRSLQALVCVRIRRS